MSENTDKNSLEVAKIIYSNLRSEILEKMKFSNQLLGFKLLSLGAIAGFVASRTGGAPNDPLLIAGVYAGAGLALSFDIALFQNNKAIITVGTYIKEQIEPWLKSIADREDLTMWEDYITRRDSSNRRQTYNFFEVANYFMSLFLMAFAAAILWQINVWYLSLLGVFAIIEMVIIARGLRR